MFKYKIQLVLIVGSFLLLGVINGCISENEEVSGLFKIQITGDIQETMEGEATFTFVPKTDYALITIRLEEDDSNYINLSFINPIASRVFLEPGDYSVVTQITPDNNNQKEVLVDYYAGTVKYTASSGSVSLRVSKETQLKGTINSAVLADINSSLSGDFDAKRQ